MSTFAEHTTLLFEFIAEDMETLAARKPGTFKDLQKALATFAGVSVRDLTVDILIELRGILIHRLLWAIGAHNYRKAVGGTREAPAYYDFPSADAVVVRWVYHEGHFIPTIPTLPQEASVDVSSPRSRFLWSCCVCLSQIDSARIRICLRDQCNRYFFAEHGNQQFCTAACSNRDRLKRYRTLATAQQPVLPPPTSGRSPARPARAQAGGRQAAVA
jgi:predicted RNA-binding Zn ribbon-like protein